MKNRTAIEKIQEERQDQGNQDLGTVGLLPPVTFSFSKSSLLKSWLPWKLDFENQDLGTVMPRQGESFTVSKSSLLKS